MNFFKFRAFVKGSSTNGTGHMIGIDLPITPYQLIGHETGFVVIDNRGLFVDKNYYEVMKYVDRKDNNGTMIYDGDLVVLTKETPNDYNRGLFVVQDYGYEVRIRDVRSELSAYDDMMEDYFYSHDSLLSDTRELYVIGNKFQNDMREELNNVHIINAFNLSDEEIKKLNSQLGYKDPLRDNND